MTEKPKRGGPHVRNDDWMSLVRWLRATGLKPVEVRDILAGRMKAQPTISVPELLKEVVYVIPASCGAIPKEVFLAYLRGERLVCSAENFNRRPCKRPLCSDKVDLETYASLYGGRCVYHQGQK